MAIIQKKFFVEPVLADSLKAVPTPTDGDVAFVARRSSADTNNDGGGMFFYDITCEVFDQSSWPPSCWRQASSPSSRPVFTGGFCAVR